MTDDVIHLIVRLEAGGLHPYASSPQAPGLVYGRPTMEELHADLQDVLGFHFDRPGPFDIVEHHERHHEVAGGELVFRLAADGHAQERKDVQAALSRALRDPLQAEGLVSAPANAVGEVVYVCAVASDTIGWILAQLGPEGDTVNIAVQVADVMVMTLPFACGREGTVSLGAKPYALDTPLSEVVRDVQIVTPAAVSPGSRVCA